MNEAKFMQRSGIITLLTDFGLTDGYVAAMKGVMLGIHPSVQLIDISHEVEAQNIQTATFLLHAHYQYFPIGTVHLAVVDPGVGGARPAVVCYASGHYFVAPDNGLLDFCIESPDLQVVRLTQRKFWLKTVSFTFHGRDIFAPVAAHLARGEPLSQFGEPFQLQRKLAAAVPQLLGKTLHGQVVYVDHFGNLVSNISAQRLQEFSQDQPITVMLNGHLIGGLCQTYTDVPPHAPLALLGSFGFLEIGVNVGSAQTRFAAHLGTPLTLTRGQLV